MFSTIARRAFAQGRGMYSCFANLRRAPSSSSWGRFVAPIIRTRPSSPERPSICTRNSVFILRELSCSPSAFRELNSESISSTKITAGSQQFATAKRALTIFSPSPIHLLVNDDAEMEKNVALHCEATALPISVLPVPGGPNSNKPRGTLRAPRNSSGFNKGHTASSCTAALACSSPAMESHSTDEFPSRISATTFSTISRSIFSRTSGIGSPFGDNRRTTCSQNGGSSALPSFAVF
mmetsp:Transcript_2080/g.8055  ORF Transcript_2080/g.8055 Transcript_2080/m.8055 type:complete len:237 (-) Transcript_2080:2073-2783(-)